MYAQFAVIGAIGAAGIMTFITSDGTDRRSGVTLRLKQYDDLAKEAKVVPNAAALDTSAEERA
jgi:hypothetical protein